MTAEPIDLVLPDGSRVKARAVQQSQQSAASWSEYLQRLTVQGQLPVRPNLAEARAAAAARAEQAVSTEEAIEVPDSPAPAPKRARRAWKARKHRSTPESANADTTVPVTPEPKELAIVPVIAATEPTVAEIPPEVARLDGLRCVKIPDDVRNAFKRRAVNRAGRAVLAAAVAKAQAACDETTVALQGRSGDPDALIEAVVGPSLRLMALERALAAFPVENAAPVVVLSELCTEAIGKLSQAVPPDVAEPLFSRQMGQWRRSNSSPTQVGAPVTMSRPVNDPPRALETDYLAEDAWKTATAELRTFRAQVQELRAQSAGAGRGWDSAVSFLAAVDDVLSRVPEVRDRIEACREVVAKADRRRDEMIGSAR